MRIPRFTFVCLLLCSAGRLAAATFVVDSTTDTSLGACTAAAADCSLRGAITAANANSGPDEIQFDIPASDPACDATTSVCTIVPSTTLPAIFDGSSGTVGPILFDGTTQSGWHPNGNSPAQGGLDAELKIVLSGLGCPLCTGLVLAEPNTVVRGLVVHGFSNNIAMDPSAHGSTVEGCFIGTDATGTAAPLAQDNGIVLGGNPFSGEAAFSVRIGGIEPQQRNLISGHAAEGMRLTGFGIQVLGNLIGTDVTGTVALGNRSGVFAEGGAGFWQYLIGNGTAAGRNVISGNRQHGIEFSSSRSVPTRDTRVQGNYIGTDVGGELPLGNGINGIVQPLEVTDDDPLQSATIGGLQDGQANRIRFNAGSGISVNRRRTQVLGNRMGANDGLGIGLPGPLRHPNDIDDPDGGVSFNNLQNFPEITTFALAGGNAELGYRVDSSVANAFYPLRIEFFKADGDEGGEFLGADVVPDAEAQQAQAVSLTLPPGVALLASDVVVATVTDAKGNTSEFSFHPAALSIVDDGPDSSPSGTPYEVSVEVVALSGPFTPHGVVLVGDGVGGSCTAALAQGAEPLTATGSCLLSSGGAPRGLTLTAGYDTFRHAFGSGTGSNLSAQAPHTLGPPPPELVTFATCMHSVSEHAGVVSVQVDRQGGGEVSVAFEHLGGSATPGADYTPPTSGVLAWSGSDMSPRFIDVVLFDDADIEAAPETFRLQLFEPLGTAINPIGLLEVQIQDDEQGRLFGSGFEGEDCPQ